MRRILYVGIALIFLTGCATSGKKRDLQIQDMQGRINTLETELENKDREIQSLQDELKISQGGNLSPEAEAALKLTKVQIQEALKNADFYEGAIDGKIGPKTEAAIMEFQKANNLKADGKVGRMTSSRLRKYLKE